MAIYNRETGERKLEGCIISQRGTFRMDTSMDEIVYWDVAAGCSKMMWLSQGDWMVEHKTDLSPEIKALVDAESAHHRAKVLAMELDHELRTVKMGSVVKVVRGRKVPPGTTGRVVHIRHTLNYISISILDDLGVEHRTYSSNIQLLINGEFADYYNVAA